MAPFAFKIQHRVDHVLNNAGASDLAFFGDVTHKNNDDAFAFGECGEFVGDGADLGYGAGGAVDVIDPHGLDGINDHEVGFFGLQRGQDIAQVGFGGQLHRGVCEF